ncbi:MAG: hypothetical protein ACR2L1_05905 [Pyrinomonadaceae bacterium]
MKHFYPLETFNRYIEIDSRCQTSVAEIFAVGDAANLIAPTVSSAVGTGATAAKTIYAGVSPKKHFST